MTEHGGAPLSTSGTLPSQTNDQLSELAKECLAKIEEYKQGPRLPLKKAQCITEITELLLKLQVTPCLTDSEINASLLLYTDIIDATDAVIQQAGQVGNHSRDHEQVEKGGIEVDPRDRSDLPDEGRASKRQKVDIDTFPWVQCERILGMQLNMSLTAMLAQDPKVTKSSILTSPRTPQFPYSKWASILTGTMVNLDHVLSGMHAVSNDNREIEVIGGIQLKYGAAEVAKKVKNAGDWSQVFCVYVKAVAFVFPHRKEELKDYAEQVTSLFVVVTEANHPIIINYDKAVRTCIGGVRNLLLTDKSEFEDLWLYWLHPLGQGFRDMNSGGTPNHSPRVNYRTNDNCLRFNNGKCPNKASGCKYRHQCANCGGRHTKKDCDRGGN